MARPQLWHALVKPRDVGEPATKHDDVRVDDVDEVTQRSGKTFFVLVQRALAVRVARSGAGDNFRRVEDNTGAFLMVARQARAGQVSFDAALAAAIALGQRLVCRLRERQRIVSPFAADGIGTGQQPAVHDDATADAGTENNSEYDRRAPPGSIDGFRQGKAIGVVGQSYLAVEQRLQIALQGLTVESPGVGIAQQADSRKRAGCTDANTCGRLQLTFDRMHQIDHRAQRGAVIVLRRRDAAANQLSSCRIHGKDFDFRAAEIDADFGPWRIHFELAEMSMP